MKFYHGLNAGMEAIQQQIVKAEKDERAGARTKVKRLCKGFDLAGGLATGAHGEGRSKE